MFIYSNYARHIYFYRSVHLTLFETGLLATANMVRRGLRQLVTGCTHTLPTDTESAARSQPTVIKSEVATEGKNKSYPVPEPFISCRANLRKEQ